MPKPNSPTLQQQEQAASTLLDNLEAEIQTTQKYNAQIRKEADGQTQKILQDRAKELEKLELEAKGRLDPLVAREATLKSEIEDLERTKIEAQTAMVGLDSQVDSQRRSLSEVIDTIFFKKGELNKLAVDRAAVVAQIDDLNEKISPLQSTIQQLQERIDSLAATRDTLKEQIDDFRTEFEMIEAQKQRAVSTLESKREHLEVQIIQMQDEFDAQRKELALRIRAADDREEVLKRRESKASRDEATNRRNAQLMNL